MFSSGWKGSTALAAAALGARGYGLTKGALSGQLGGTVAGAAYGAIGGGMYGAMSSNTSVLGGATMGAGLGAGLGRYGTHGVNTAFKSAQVGMGRLDSARDGFLAMRNLAKRDIDGAKLAANKGVTRVGSSLKGWGRGMGGGI